MAEKIRRKPQQWTDTTTTPLERFSHPRGCHGWVTSDRLHGRFRFRCYTGPRPTSPRPLLRLWRPVSQIGSKWKGEMKHKKHFVKCWIGVFLFGFDFAKCEATYGYLTPDLWKPTSHCKSPFQAVCGWVPWVQSHSENLGCQEWSDWLSQSQKAQGLNNGTQNGSLKWLDKDAELFLVELVYFFHVFLY